MVRVVKSRGYKLLLQLLLVLSLIFYIIHPESYSSSYVTCCFVISICSVICYFRSQQKDNYFDFDSIFISILLVCFFSYPVFFHGRDLGHDFFTINHILNANRISSSTGLSAIAICSYCLGATSVIKPKIRLNKGVPYVIPTKGLTVIFTTLIIFTLFNGSLEYYQNLYKEGLDEAQYSSLNGQLTSIAKVFFFVIVGTEAYNYNNGKRKLNLLFIFTTLIFSTLMLYVGNRTLASEFLLSSFFFFFYYKRNIELWELLGLLLLAFMGMYFVQLFRQGVEVNSVWGVHIIGDFMGPYRMNLVAMDYVDKFDYTYGVSLLGPITGIIPSFSRFLQYFGVDISYLDSASLFTTFEQGKVHTSGLGTSLQAEAYLAFGVIGILIFFYYIGKFTKYSFIRMREGSYYYFIIYSIIVGHSVYWVRSLVFIFANMIVWGLIIAYLNVNNRKNKKIE